MAWLRNAGLLACLTIAVAAWIALPWPGVIALLLLLVAWLLLTRSGGQTLSVAFVGVSTLTQRLGAAAVIVVGIAAVVGVLVAMLSMAEGYSEMLRKSGSDDTAIVMRGAAASEVMSVLSREAVALIKQVPGVARNAKGEMMASDELVVAANLPVKSGGPDEEGSVQLRGVGEQAWSVRPQVKIIAGRRFNSGLRELVVGRGASRLFAGLTPGNEVRLGAQVWSVVGVFASGDAMESEVWADANVVADTYGTGSSRASVTLKLAEPKVFDEIKNALESNPQLSVDVSTTKTYFTKQSEGVTNLLRSIGIAVGAIMAVGAMFGALNTMYAAVETRAREIATLRAIGFSGLPVVVAVMLESMLLALIGGLVGGILAYVVFNGYGAATMAVGSVGRLNFELRVSPELFWTGLKWALAIGFVGGLFPAVRAARVPVVTALREL